MKIILFIFTLRVVGCSIVGYIGDKPCKNIILLGLSKLEYRGYDSAGIAIKNGDLNFIKAEGELKNLVSRTKAEELIGTTGIGHTRWATHGRANEKNAHPHLSSDNKIAVVHNGIIENFQEIKQELEQKGIQFKSDTDTEVVPHLISCELKKTDNLKEAIQATVKKLKGAFGLLVLLKDREELIAIRKGSPLCIGLGQNEKFIASDCLAFTEGTNKVFYLPEESFSFVTKDQIESFSFDGRQIPLTIQTVDVGKNTFDLTGFKHYMLKEIYEQPTIIKSCAKSLASKEDLLGKLKIDAKNLKSINFIGCGTSWHAARTAQFYFEKICKIPTNVYLASEFRYMSFFPQEDSLYISISQSGETADTLEAIRLIKSYNLNTLAITNVVSSSLARESSSFILAHCGPEISVAATKSFTAQLSALYYLANLIGFEKGVITKEDLDESLKDLEIASDYIEQSLKFYRHRMKKWARRYWQSERFIFVGRHICYPLAMEAALKLKETSYIFALGYPAGELKHGAIALIDIKTPVMIFSHSDQNIYKKVVSNAQEIKARNAHIISVLFEDQSELKNLSDLYFEIPRVKEELMPLVMASVMQQFVYNIADQLGCSIDKPRNLAKSVTVE